jgi:hypothetical protein
MGKEKRQTEELNEKTKSFQILHPAGLLKFRQEAVCLYHQPSQSIPFVLHDK